MTVAKLHVAQKGMMVRQIERATTADAIDRIASDHIARPEVELVYVVPPASVGGMWRAEIYTDATAARPRASVLVPRHVVEHMMRAA